MERPAGLSRTPRWGGVALVMSCVGALLALHFGPRAFAAPEQRSTALPDPARVQRACEEMQAVARRYTECLIAGEWDGALRLTRGSGGLDGQQRERFIELQSHWRDRFRPSKVVSMSPPGRFVRTVHYLAPGQPGSALRTFRMDYVVLVENGIYQLAGDSLAHWVRGDRRVSGRQQLQSSPINWEACKAPWAKPGVPEWVEPAVSRNGSAAAAVRFITRWAAGQSAGLLQDIRPWRDSVDRVPYRPEELLPALHEWKEHAPFRLACLSCSDWVVVVMTDRQDDPAGRFKMAARVARLAREGGEWRVALPWEPKELVLGRSPADALRALDVFELDQTPADVLWERLSLLPPSVLKGHESEADKMTAARAWARDPQRRDALWTAGQPTCCVADEQAGRAVVSVEVLCTKDVAETRRRQEWMEYRFFTFDLVRDGVDVWWRLSEGEQPTATPPGPVLADEFDG